MVPEAVEHAGRLVGLLTAVGSSAAFLLSMAEANPFDACTPHVGEPRLDKPHMWAPLTSHQSHLSLFYGHCGVSRHALAGL